MSPDPEQLYDQLTSGDVARILAVADPLDAAVSGLGEAGGTVTAAAATATAGWQGASADGFDDRVARTGEAVEVAAGRLSEVAGAVRGVADAYRTTRASADRSIQAWRNRPAGADPVAERKLAAEVYRALDEVRDGYEQVLAASAAGVGEIEPGFAEVLEQQTGWAQTDVFDPLDIFGSDDFTDGPLIPHTPLSGDPFSTWIPQGLTYRESQDQLLMTYYDEKDESDGMLSVIDNGTGDEVKNLELRGPETTFGPLTLPTTGPTHSGGAAATDDHLWVTSTVDGKSYVHRYGMEDIDDASSGDPVSSQDVFEVKASSYATYADGKLWVGDFDGNKLYAYELENGEPVGEPVEEYTTPPKSQGVVVRDGELIYSRSEGRGNPSALTAVPRGDYDSDGESTELTAPNMSEGITLVGDEIYTAYESPAQKYLDADGKDIAPRNRLTKTPLSALTGADGYAVEPAALREGVSGLHEGAGQFGAVADGLSGTRLVASVLGEVATADAFGAAVTEALHTHGADVAHAARWVEYLASEVTSTASAYEEQEQQAESVLTKIAGLFD